MSALKVIQLTAQKADQALTPEKKRFNTLSKQIAKARKDHSSWQSKLPGFRVDCINTIAPQRQAYLKAKREIAFAMDRVLDRVKLSQEMQDDLKDCLLAGIQSLTEHTPMDEELKQLFEKHSSVSFDEFKLAEADMVQSFVSQFTGQTMDEKQDHESHDDYMDRLHDHLQEQIELEKKRRQAQKSEKEKIKTAKSSPPKKDELLAQNLLKDVFRKLVSALHPDREKDPNERARKTQLMQEINRAYSNNELMTLLHLQLEIEQIEQSDLQDLAAEKLNAYNQLLATELNRVRQVTQDELDRFCAENYLPRLKSQLMKSDDLKVVIKHVEHAMEEEVEILLDELEFLYGVKKSTRQLKAWIHQQMFALDNNMGDFD